MSVTEIKYFRPFQKLVDEVVVRSGMNKTFSDFGKGDFERLARIFEHKVGTHHIISPNTFRDYRYIYLRKKKYPFSVSESKLDILCDFLGYRDWINYLDQQGEMLQTPSASNKKQTEEQDLLNKTNRKKVFVCFSHYDESFANVLKQDLSAHGIACWLYSDHLITGDDTIAKISDSLRESGIVIAVISKNSITSKWVSKELSWSLNEEMQNDSVKVMPVLIDQTAPHFFLSEKRYVDFTSNYSKALEKLAKDILKFQKSGNVDEDLIGENIVVRPKRTKIELVTVTVLITLLLLGILAVKLVSPYKAAEVQFLINDAVSILLFGIVFSLAEIFRVLLVMMYGKRDVVFAKEYESLHAIHLAQKAFWKLMNRYIKKPMVFMILVVHLLVTAGMLILVYNAWVWIRQVYHYMF